MTRLPASLRRPAYRAAYPLARIWWFVARPNTHGVKLLIRDPAGRTLFVRHTYGPAVWELPGGGRRRNESPLAAARRECAEELGLRIDAWQEIGQIVSRRRATAHLTCLVAAFEGTLRVDAGEIAAVRWAPTGDPPQPLGELAEAVLALG